MSATNGFHVHDIESVLSGKEHIVEAEKPRNNKVLRPVAKAASRRVKAQAQAEVMNEVLGLFIESVYERDDDGRFWNVGPYGRIELPIPWGDDGRHKWNVKRTMANVIRHAMTTYSKKNDCPFIFDGFESRWYLDTENYPTDSHAHKWLRKRGITASMWLKIHDSWKKSRRK